MEAFSPRTRLIACLVLAGVGLALFFGGDYRDIPLLPSEFPMGWSGTFLFVAAVWFCVDLVDRIPHSDEEAAIAPGEWQAWVGIAFCVIGIALMLGFSDTGRLREFSYPYIAQLLVQALLWGLWFEQVASAVLYWRDRRAMA